jgi:hypothetical protein
MMSGTYAEDRSSVTGRLRDLLDNDVLEHPTTRAIANLAAESGLSILAPDQRDIYEWHIKPLLGNDRSDGAPESIIV